MQKIPTVFLRDQNDRSLVTSFVNPECQWVLDGEGVPTRKFDGTCVFYDGEVWWARREVKPGKTPPEHFWPLQHDDVTGKTVGWEPIGASSFYKFWAEALGDTDFTSGTYELVGPKVNGNPEGLDTHRLIPHADAEQLTEFLPDDGHRDFATIRETVLFYAKKGYEGIVYHHPDGRKAKIKARDFQ